MILKIPINNSIINNSIPSLHWFPGADEDNDLLTYFVQVDELGDNWTSTLDFKHCGFGILNHTLTYPLMDGNYHGQMTPNKLRKLAQSAREAEEEVVVDV